MPLAYEHIRSTLSAQPLFEDKSWQLSPDAWPLTPDQKTQLEAIGAACLEFHQALETLYLRSAAGEKSPAQQDARGPVGRGLPRPRQSPTTSSPTRATRRIAGRFRRCFGPICC